eukprot:355986-Chlamydomonas_euryale.AAC.12
MQVMLAGETDPNVWITGVALKHNVLTLTLAWLDNSHRCVHACAGHVCWRGRPGRAHHWRRARCPLVHNALVQPKSACGDAQGVVDAALCARGRVDCGAFLLSLP